MMRTSMLLAVAWSAAITQNPPVQQGTGAISGIVRDAYTGQPIEGAAVFVQGEAFGTITKANGSYTILGVPPGTYTVVARIVGYVPLEAENVVVRADVRRELIIQMTMPGRSTTTEPVRARPGLTVVSASTAEVESCSGTPGARFGIVSLQSASMTIENDGGQTIFSFQAEPVVINVTSWSLLRSGDVIQSVNGEPITTRAGAENFANPPPGSVSSLLIRRNGETMSVNKVCTPPVGGAYPGTMNAQGAGRGRGGRGGGVAGGSQGRSDGTDTVRAAGGVASGGRLVIVDGDTVRAGGVAAGSISSGRGGRAQGGGRSGGGVAGARTVITTETIPARGSDRPSDILADSTTPVVAVERYGLLLVCTPVCRRARGRDGTPYWRFDELPVVRTAALPSPRDFTNADAPLREAISRGRGVGLHPGTVILEVNGKSPLTEEGSRLLNHLEEHFPLTLQVRRGADTDRITLRGTEQAR